MIATPDQEPIAGDFAIFWPRGDERPFIKRVLMPFLAGFGGYGPNWDLVPLALVEQFNPPRRYEISADRIGAAHAVVGWLKPGEYKRELIQ